jgi:hypothetical protein
MIELQVWVVGGDLASSEGLILHQAYAAEQVKYTYWGAMDFGARKDERGVVPVPVP